MVIVKTKNKEVLKILSPVLYKCLGGTFVFPYKINILKKYIQHANFKNLEEICVVFSKDNEVVECKWPEII